MARNFSKMTKDELHSIINSADFEEMDLADLNALRKAASAVGILDTFDGDKIAMKINNKTYTDIKNADNYTAEEKALAKDARDEYNAEIRTNRAKKILKRATIVDGKYVFDSLTVREASLLEQAGYLGKYTADKDVYRIGQEKDQTLLQLVMAAKQNAEKRETVSSVAADVKPVVVNEISASDDKENVIKEPEVKEVDNKTQALPADLQKSYDFWSKFNENQKNSGIKYTIDNIENKHLLVEAKKGDKTLFKGIDHGSKGFDILKQDKDAEAYEMFDMLVKKVKARNPKTVIRVKDNVTDEVLRNKILIACAKNNMKPVGNLPEGFDFEELKELVKELKTTEDMNALAEDLYRDSEYNFGQEFSNGHSRTDKDKSKDHVAPAAIVTRTGGNGNRPLIVDEAENNPPRRQRRSAVIVNKNEENNPPRRQRRNAVIVNVDDDKNNNIPASEKEEKKHTVIPAVVATNSGNGGNSDKNNHNGGNGGNNNNRGAGGTVVTTGNNKSQPNSNRNKNKDDKKKVGFWGNLWDKAKNAVLIGAIAVASFFGVKSCQQDKEVNRKTDDIEQLAQKNDSLLNVIDGKDKDIKTLQEALDDCNESKKPKPVIKKKRRTTPVIKKEEKKPEIKKPVDKKPVDKKPVEKQEEVKKDTLLTPSIDILKKNKPKEAPVYKEPTTIDMGKKHEPIVLESTPNAQDLEDAELGVIDFGRRHGPDYDGLPHNEVDVFSAGDQAGKQKENTAQKDTTFVDFYKVIKGNYYK